jgi:hypothetical protein
MRPTPFRLVIVTGLLLLAIRRDAQAQDSRQTKHSPNRNSVAATTLTEYVPALQCTLQDWANELEVKKQMPLLQSGDIKKYVASLAKWLKGKEWEAAIRAHAKPGAGDDAITKWTSVLSKSLPTDSALHDRMGDLLVVLGAYTYAELSHDPEYKPAEYQKKYCASGYTKMDTPVPPIGNGGLIKPPAW